MENFTFNEAKELPPMPDLKVDFVRHGKPVYTKEEMESLELEGELTPEGEVDIKRKALNLSSQLDKEKELIVFWVSPKRRAQQTAKVMRGVFLDQGVSVLKEPKTFQSLADIKVNKAFFADLIKNGALNDWMEYWVANELPEGTEKPQDVRKRVTKVMTFLDRVARNVKPEGNKKLHFIVIGHEEIFRDILEDAYGFGTKKGTGPDYGESLSLDFTKSEPGKNADIKLQFRGKEAKLELDKNTRSLNKPATS